MVIITKKTGIYINTLKVVDATKKDITDCFDKTTIKMTSEEVTLERKLQEHFYEDYAKDLSILYGNKLYHNEELLCPSINLSPNSRLIQYFLRNGREKTFEVADQLGCKYHQTVLSPEAPITKMFVEAGIDITGDTIERIEVPGGRSGSIVRDGIKYGGKDEQIMTVESLTTEPDTWIKQPAEKSGYTVDIMMEFEGMIANEMSHEIQNKYFPRLFSGDNRYKLTEPFKSFSTEIPGLHFTSNAQAGEFLSDAADWNTSAPYGCQFRFFNPLWYMSENSFMGGKDSRYGYSYQVQQYAMEQILKKKGYKNYKKIVAGLIEEAEKSDYTNHEAAFFYARTYFDEKDFEEIAKVYRKIVVELLKTMQSYFKK